MGSPLRRLHGLLYGGASPSNTSASKKPRMEPTESSEPFTKARFSATPKLKHLTAFEAAPFIKPPALRGCRVTGIPTVTRPIVNRPLAAEQTRCRMDP